MGPGELIRLTTFKTHMSDGKSWVEYRSEKGEVAVALLLGTEPRKGMHDDDHWIAALNAIGFVRTDQLTPEELDAVTKRINAKAKAKKP